MQVARLWRDARDCLQALRILIGLGIRADVSCQIFDLLLGIDQLIRKQAQGFASGFWQTGLFAGNDQPIDIVYALRNDDAEFAQVRASRRRRAFSTTH